MQLQMGMLVTDPTAAMTATLRALQTHFDATDAMRRLQGDTLASLGFGARECPYEVTAEGTHWRLRDYGNRHAPNSLLIVAAPIKRPYIWDLAPTLSTIGYCLAQGLHVRLLEWLPAAQNTNDVGLDECADAMARCVAQATDEDSGSKPFLAGHSLGGTLAAIHAAKASDSIRGLILLSTPLCFEARRSHFRDALVSMVPPQLPGGQPFPGSLLTHMSVLASPATFVWSRLVDRMMSLTDQRAGELHARVERWALDEAALPGRLVQQIIESLYRDNRFFQGTLRVGGDTVGPSSLTAPVIAVVNIADDVAPAVALKPFTDALPAGNVRVVDFLGETGACLQHLAILVGREARQTIWPEIMTWIESRARKAEAALAPVTTS